MYALPSFFVPLCVYIDTSNCLDCGIGQLFLVIVESNVRHIVITFTFTCLTRISIYSLVFLTTFLSGEEGWQKQR